jgi:hypothetical protein
MAADAHQRIETGAGRRLTRLDGYEVPLSIEILMKCFSRSSGRNLDQPERRMALDQII